MVQRLVRADEVDALGRDVAEIADVPLAQLDATVEPVRSEHRTAGLDHAVGQVDADYSKVRPAARQMREAARGAAPEVEHRPSVRHELVDAARAQLVDRRLRASPDLVVLGDGVLLVHHHRLRDARRGRTACILASNRERENR